MEEPRPRRRWWIWLVAAVVVLAAVAATPALHMNEFSFLDRYHPRVDVGEDQIGSRVNDKCLYYIFDGAYSSEVLAALERELPKKGYSKYRGAVSDSASFLKPVGSRDVGAVFLSARTAGGFAPEFALKHHLAPGQCVVWIVREPTWLENQVDAVKKLLPWK